MRRFFFILIFLFSQKLLGNDGSYQMLSASVEFLIEDSTNYKNVKPCKTCANLEELKAFYENNTSVTANKYVLIFIDKVVNLDIYKNNNLDSLSSIIQSKLTEKHSQRPKEYPEAWKNLQTKLNNIVKSQPKDLTTSNDDVSIINDTVTDYNELDIPKQSFLKSNNIYFGLIVLCLIIFGLLVYFFKQLNNLKKKLDINFKGLDKLKTEILTLNDKISSFENKLLEKAKEDRRMPIIEPIKETPKEILKENLALKIEPPKPENKKKERKLSSILYGNKSNNGVLLKDECSKEFNSKLFYEIHHFDDNTYELHLTNNKEAIDYICMFHDPKGYLKEDVCEYFGEYQKNNKIGMSHPGRLTYNETNSSWNIVEKKLGITFKS